MKERNKCNLSAEKYFDSGIMRSKRQLDGLKLLLLFSVVNGKKRNVHITMLLPRQDK